MDAATLIELQNKVADISARARETQRNIKYHQQELERLAAGYYRVDSDTDFVPRNTKRHQDELDKATGALMVYEELLGKLEDQRTPSAKLPHATLLTYFQGNNREAARGGLELLALCLKADCWVPGASKRVQSVLHYSKAAKRDQADYKAGTGFLQTLFNRWTSMRPKPVFTKEGASPTVTATIKNLGATDVNVCPIEYDEVKVVDPKTGKETIRYVGRLVWPAGTKHGTSRYQGTNSNRQCEACGHAIKNMFNWVPLVLTTPECPKSLWVGRDCAKTLFGIDMTGDLEIAE